MRRLAADLDLRAALAAALAEAVPGWRGEAQAFGVLPSTNDWLKTQARAGARPWRVTVARAQTGGRGRGAHTWASPPGNLYLSLLAPALPPERLTLLPLAVGLAARDAVLGWGVEARLKWPNDLMAGGGKLGGILCEALAESGRVEAVVVGIGLNLLEVPAGAAPGAVCVAGLGGRVPALAAAAAAVIARVWVWYHALASPAPAPVVTAWMAASVPWWGREVEVRSGGEAVVGVAQGLDPTGALLLCGADGQVRRVMSGEARELRLSPPA